MRIIALFFVVFGIALAGGAIFFASQYFRMLEANAVQTKPGPRMISVITAKQRLERGDRISIDNADGLLSWTQWPETAVPQGSFVNVEALFGAGNRQYRTVLRAIEPGELVLKTKVSGFGEGARVATRVSEGKRAFTIPVDAVRGVAGLIAPGDRVDILLTRKINQMPTTSVILQDVLVIAMDQASNEENNRARVARTATVEIDPAQVSKLALAQSVGSLSLSLRGVNESVNADVGPVRITDLPDQPRQQVINRPAPQPTVRVRKGGQIQSVIVD